MARWRAKTPVEGVCHPANAAAVRALSARTGPPTEDDALPVSTFPGRKARELPGQMKIDEVIVEPREPSPRA